MGAHASAPSRAQDGNDWVSLIELIGRDPDEYLGVGVVDRFGARLPFLLKVLAAAQPLSLQVHPTQAQAAEGYAREDVSGVLRGSDRRTYRDRNHKPELLCALTPFDALSGFRHPSASAELWTTLAAAGASALRPYARRLEAGELAAVFWDLWDLSTDEVARLVAAAAEAAAKISKGAWVAEARIAQVLAARYPSDSGVLASLLLNRVRLQPGEALYSPAGRLHAYLGGVAVEVMASSDNVVRAGLTSKYVNLAELASILDVTPEEIEPLQPVASDLEEVYPSPAAEFRLSRLSVREDAPFRTEPWGPEILICLGGSVAIDGIALARGESVFVPACQPPYQIEGQGLVYRACVGG